MGVAISSKNAKVIQAIMPFEMLHDIFGQTGISDAVAYLSYNLIA